jgi:hypothetical protein
MLKPNVDKFLEFNNGYIGRVYAVEIHLTLSSSPDSTGGI